MSSGSHGVLSNGEWLPWGQSLWSLDKSTEFKMQEDGKIAVYHSGKLQFQNTTQQRYDIKGIKMQEDGNLAMYPSGNNTTITAVQNDRNVVLYNGTAIWDTKTDH